MLVHAYAITSLSTFTLRLPIVCGLLQVKEEDEVEEENTMVLYFICNKLQFTPSLPNRFSSSFINPMGPTSSLCPNSYPFLIKLLTKYLFIVVLNSHQNSS